MLPASFAARCLAGALIAVSSLVPGPTRAQGDLLIAPTRLVLDGRRGGEVILSNVGAEEAVYRVTLELRRMTTEGELVPVEGTEVTSSEQAALDMIRYAPRRVTLPPGEPQAIRISARPGPELPDGEYRAHMSLSAVPKVRPVSPQAEASTSEGFSVQITPIYGITMPIIVRKGEVRATAGLANPRIGADERGSSFEIDITRSGAASIYGDLLVYRQGADEPVFVARGLGVYPEIGARHARFAISSEQRAAMHGPVRVELRDPVASGGALIAALDADLR